MKKTLKSISTIVVTREYIFLTANVLITKRTFFAEIIETRSFELFRPADGDANSWRFIDSGKEFSKFSRSLHYALQGKVNYYLNNHNAY